nr:hypothetical protein HmN_000310700 [Hymenolepis microstoma]
MSLRKPTCIELDTNIGHDILAYSEVNFIVAFFMESLVSDCPIQYYEQCLHLPRRDGSEFSGSVFLWPVGVSQVHLRLHTLDAIAKKHCVCEYVVLK